MINICIEYKLISTIGVYYLFELRIEDLVKLLGIKLVFEGPSNWAIREYISVIDEYLIERLPVILNNLLEPYGLEPSILEKNEACESINKCSDEYIVVGIYDSSYTKPLFYVIYRRRIGDNTYEFSFHEIIQNQ